MPCCAPREADQLPAQNLTRTRYLPSFTFQDPIVKVSSLEAFALNLRLLRTVFDVDFELHSCRVAGPTEIVTRCASGLQAVPVGSGVYHCVRLWLLTEQGESQVLEPVLPLQVMPGCGGLSSALVPSLKSIRNLTTSTQTNIAA